MIGTAKTSIQHKPWQVELKAETLSFCFNSITRNIHRTPKDLLLKEINEISKTCNVNNWDDEGAKAINSESIKYIKKFVDLLSDEIAMPEPAPEPSGWMGLEWAKGDVHIALSIDSKGELVYAIFNQEGSRSATLQFSDKIPDELFTFFKFLK